MLTVALTLFSGPSKKSQTTGAEAKQRQQHSKSDLQTPRQTIPLVTSAVHSEPPAVAESASSLGWEIKELRKSRLAMEASKDAFLSAIQQLNNRDSTKQVSTDALPFSIPLFTVKEFTNMEKILKTDKTATNTLKELMSHEGGNTLRCTVLNATRLVFTNELGQCCNWTGQGNKIAVKNSVFVSLIFDVVHAQRKYDNVTKDQVNLFIKNWLHQSTKRLESKKRHKHQQDDLDNESDNLMSNAKRHCSQKKKQQELEDSDGDSNVSLQDKQPRIKKLFQPQDDVYSSSDDKSMLDDDDDDSMLEDD